MKSFVMCANDETRTCPNRRQCVTDGVACVHLIIGFEKESEKKWRGKP